MTRIDLSEGQSPSAHTVSIGPLTLVFSYSTCVAFAVRGEGWCVSENIWSKTTGKHLNQETPTGAKRVPNEEFEERLQQVLARIEVRSDQGATS